MIVSIPLGFAKNCIQSSGNAPLGFSVVDWERFLNAVVIRR